MTVPRRYNKHKLDLILITGQLDSKTNEHKVTCYPKHSLRPGAQFFKQYNLEQSEPGFEDPMFCFAIWDEGPVVQK